MVYKFVLQVFKMADKKGLFIVFEGIDGSGKTTQIERLANYIRRKDKYQDVLLTKEPTWRAEELKKILATQKDVYSGGEECANHFLEDRRIHTYGQILPELKQRSHVLCDRFILSTAYQFTQGVELSVLIKMHNDRQIPTPDLTYFVDTSVDECIRRRLERGEPPEKFEKDIGFQEKLRDNYLLIIDRSNSFPESVLQKLIGKVAIIDGNPKPEKVSSNIFREFDDFCLSKNK